MNREQQNHVPYEAEAYRPYMDGVVLPWLKEHRREGTCLGYDGRPLRYHLAVNPDAKGIIVMLHGFCCFFGKYYETFYDFYQQGYTVFFLEHRGHGGSYRPVSDPDMADITSFDEYVGDLKAFLDGVVLPEREAESRKAGSGRTTGKTDSGRTKACRLPLFLFAHSMGGCIGTLFLEKYQGIFDAAVLCSPMLKMNFGTTPVWKMKLVALGTRLLGWNDKYVPGQGPFSGKPEFEISGASCRTRYQYTFEQRVPPIGDGRDTLNGASCRWARAALKATMGLDKDEGRIQTPLLILQAGKDSYVMNPAEDQLAKTAPDARLVAFPEAKHEIFLSEGAVLDKFYRTIFAFLEEHS